jgi:hypothetical protein
VRAVEHAKDSPFGATRAVAETAAAFNTRQDVISVHGVAQTVATDEEVAVQIFARRIRHDEAVTVSMRHQTPGQLIHFRPRRRGGFSLRLSTVPLRPLLRLRRIFSAPLGTSLRIAFRALFLLGQANSAIRIFVNVAAFFHFSCELHERPASGMAQIQRRGDFTEALRLARPGQVGEDVGFGDGCARLSGAWHGPAHCMRSASKR